MRKAILAVAAGAVTLAFSLCASANGRFPKANQVVFSPTDPNYIVLRTSYALLPSSDNGKTWRYVCEDVLGLPASLGEDPSIGITSNNTLLAGVPGYVGGSRGLDISPDKGCNWSCGGGGLTDQSVVDVAVRADTPTSAVALTGTILPNDAGIDDINSVVFETTNNGTTWTALPASIDHTVSVTTVDVAKSDPDRIYVSGTRGYGATHTAVLFVSMNHGKSWTERAVPQFDPNTEFSIFIGAVDPTNADRVYLRTNAPVLGGVSRVLYSNDAGKTFALANALPIDGGFDVPEAGVYDSSGELLGFALSPDGSRVYIGTAESGLWIANRDDMVFHQKNPDLHVLCLATRNNELWACGDILSGFTLGVSTDDGATFTSKMEYVTSVCGPLACDPTPPGTPPTYACGGTQNASQCEPNWELFCGQNDVTISCGGPDSCGLGDAGTAPSDAAAPPSDAGGAVSDAGAAPGTSSSSCGCSTVGGRGTSGFLAAIALAFAATRRRRNRR